MQGWSPDFVSKLTEEAVAAGLVDDVVPVAGADALMLARELARQEGIFVGTSSGATLAAALTIARRSRPGTNIVCMLPDTGERYMSTPLFEEIGEEMTDEELEISRSTVSCRFDVPAPQPARDEQPETTGHEQTETARSKAGPAPAASRSASEIARPRDRSGRAAAAGRAQTPAAAAEPGALDVDAVRFVDAVLRDEPVVMFALEWCEFCWSVRKLFARLRIPYRSVDLDSVEYQAGDRGGKIRAVLAERTGVKTIPRIFIGGEHIGGATETFDAWRDGSAQARLAELDVDYDRTVDIDPYSLLPKWLQPRKSA